MHAQHSSTRPLHAGGVGLNFSTTECLAMSPATSGNGISRDIVAAWWAARHDLDKHAYMQFML